MHRTPCCASVRGGVLDAPPQALLVIRRAGCPHPAADTHRTPCQNPCHCEPVTDVTGVAIRTPHAPHSHATWGNGFPRRSAPRNDIFMKMHCSLPAGCGHPALQSLCRFRRGRCPHRPAGYAPHPHVKISVIANQRARWFAMTILGSALRIDGRGNRRGAAGGGRSEAVSRKCPDWRPRQWAGIGWHDGGQESRRPYAWAGCAAQTGRRGRRPLHNFINFPVELPKLSTFRFQLTSPRRAHS